MKRIFVSFLFIGCIKSEVPRDICLDAKGEVSKACINAVERDFKQKHVEGM